MDDAPARPLPLFAYGTLSERGTLNHLLGTTRRRTLLTAELPDYEKIWLNGYGYPFVVPRPGRRVVGTLVQGLASADYVTLDEYEDLPQGDYERVVARVRPLVAGAPEPLEAYVYVLGPRWRSAAVAAERP